MKISDLNIFKRIDDSVRQGIVDKVSVGVAAAMDQMPMLDRLLEGKEVDVAISIEPIKVKVRLS